MTNETEVGYSYEEMRFTHMTCEKEDYSTNGEWGMKKKKVLVFLVFCQLFLSAAGLLAASDSEEWLASHNTYRILHQGAPLRWSVELAESASVHAEECSKGHSKSSYGENIAWATYDQTPDNVVDRWYEEEAEYDYDSPGFSRGIGHFSQIVWRETSEVGCACRSDCSGRFSNFCVCQYNPPGNYRNEFSDNVLPPNKQ